MSGKILLIAVCLATGISITSSHAAGESTEGDADKELQKFQGSWVMVGGERDGKKVADEDVKRSKMVYKGKIIEVMTPHQSSETVVADIVKIDPTKTPKQMHFIRRNGPSAGIEITGIYEFEGPDRYKFAFDPAGKTVPKAFVTKEGSGQIAHTWKRQK